MNIERIKEIQKETAYPDSISVQQALLKVWNECTQGKVVNKNDLLPDVSNRRELLIAFADAINVCDGDKRKIRKLVDIYLKSN